MGGNVVRSELERAVAEAINASPTGSGRVIGLITAQYLYYDDMFSGGTSDWTKSNSVRGMPAESVLGWWFNRW